MAGVPSEHWADTISQVIGVLALCQPDSRAAWASRHCMRAVRRHLSCPGPNTADWLSIVHIVDLGVTEE